MPSARAGKVIEKIRWIGKKAHLSFSTEEELLLSENAFVEFHLYEGKELLPLELKKLKEYAALDELYGYAIKLLSARSYTVSEMRRKLYNRKREQNSIGKIIDRLLDKGLLNDQSYAKMYLEDAYEVKLFGKKRIVYELEKKGIATSIVVSLPFSERKELEGARRLCLSLNKRYARLANSIKKEKVMAVLKTRGYSREVAAKAVEDIAYNDETLEVSLLEKEYNKAKARYSRKYEGYSLRQKITAFLLSKGYRYEDIRKMEDDTYEDNC